MCCRHSVTNPGTLRNNPKKQRPGDRSRCVTGAAAGRRSVAPKFTPSAGPYRSIPNRTCRTQIPAVTDTRHPELDSCCSACIPVCYLNISPFGRHPPHCPLARVTVIGIDRPTGHRSEVVGANRENTQCLTNTGDMPRTDTRLRRSVDELIAARVARVGSELSSHFLYERLGFSHTH